MNERELFTILRRCLFLGFRIIFSLGNVMTGNTQWYIAF